MRSAVAFAVAVAALAACGAETTPRWDLVHDRIVAARASRPALAAGERASLDLLVTSVADGPAEAAPLAVELAPQTPAPLVGTVGADGGWHVTAPEAAAIDAARAALGLDAGEPVPLGLVLTVAIDGRVFVATKTVWLGEPADNPTIDEVRVGGAVADTSATAVVGEVELAVDAPAGDTFAWLTLFGDLEDIDDAVAHLIVDEPTSGDVVVVVRDDRGGLAWRVLALQVDSIIGTLNATIQFEE